MTDILLMASIIGGITVGIVQAIKVATEINKRYVPLMAILVGIVIGGLAYFIDIEIGMRLWAGAIAGLASVGLYEGIDKTVQPEKNIKRKL